MRAITTLFGESFRNKAKPYTDSPPRRKLTNKKNKTWDGDGVLAVRDGFGTLTDEDGKEMGRTRCSGPLLPDTIISMSGKEIQIEGLMRTEDYLAAKRSRAAPPKASSMSELDDKLRTSVNFKSSSRPQSSDQVKNESASKRHQLPVPQPVKTTQTTFKNPMIDDTVLHQTTSEIPTPRHDPEAPGAVVMKRPDTVPNGKQIVDVVVDPNISKRLREHQVEGIKFMYECVMSMRPYCGDGAILADEMGLGKTLQVIALLWTLMKQNPIADDPPAVSKAVIVCPVTLIRNWRQEFRKWLGKERIGVFVMDDVKTKITDFTHGKTYGIMLIGYEKLRTVAPELQKGTGIDIVIADEGHRLKTAKNKAGQAIKSLPTTKKIILSGTPLQNDLSEFYFMVDLVNPDLLGKVNTFKKEFETPILKSRQPKATEKELEKGEARSEELSNLTSMFIIRRSADLLAKYLPHKTEYVLFCNPTTTQATIYRSVLATPEFTACLTSPEATLQLITILKKLCNSPSLLKSAGTDITDSGADPAKTDTSLITAILSHLPRHLLRSPGASGKLQVLDSLLHRIRTTTREKVVIVSHYTATLDMLQTFFNSLSYSTLRLDGSTPQSKRQELVDRFNRQDAEQSFAFLLSAKSGGVGINLIGASRLILFDNDWNPSQDLQAMARIHRDGQRRPCIIYRLLTKGALDEKIFQRQATKLSLADNIVDGKGSTSNFSPEALRDLFRLDEGVGCQTHQLLGCTCEGRGIDTKPAEVDPADLLEKVFEEAEEVGGAEGSEGVMKEEDDGAEEEESSFPTLSQIIKSSQYEELSRRAEQEEAKAIAKRKEKEKDKMVALMQYRHFETAGFSNGAELAGEAGGLKGKNGGREEGMVEGEQKGDDESKASEDEGYADIDELEVSSGVGGKDGVIEDEVLMDVLRDAEKRIGFVFAKTSV